VQHTDSGVLVTVIGADGPIVRLKAQLAATPASCPSCLVRSDRCHGAYVRQLLDQPWRGHQVSLVLTVRRFRCDNAACERRTFAEDCGPSLPRHARRTREATTELLDIVKVAGAEAAARLARKRGLPVSADTLLRLERQVRLAPGPTPRILGIDDFALRRGQSYGTIFVDLETHQPVDLLEGREASVVEAWLKGRVGIEVIVRDRSGAYADGARAGAPQAEQAADRFHLLRNVGEALDELLRRGKRQGEAQAERPQTGAIDLPAPEHAGGPVSGAPVRDEPTPNGSQTPDTLAPASPAPPAPSALSATPASPTPSVPLSPSRQRRLERRQARVAKWQEVRARRANGQSISQIARSLGMCRRTVRNYLATDEQSSNKAEHPKLVGKISTKLLPFVPYLERRWAEGCQNVAQLLREIKADGYPASRTLLINTLKPWRPPRPSQREKHLQKKATLRWLVLRPPESLKPDEKHALDQFLAANPDVGRGHALAQQFRRLVKERDVSSLDVWLEAARQSKLSTFVGLANGIEADRAAVEAGLRLPWSNGPVEGHITKLKLTKRQGYGRASFDLLRRRVLVA